MQQPRLRFKVFNDEWKKERLKSLVIRVTRKNTNLESDRPLTISARNGLVDQRKFFNKVVASKNVSNYILLKNGEFAYNKSYSNTYPYGAVKRLDKYDKGVLSTLYIAFKPVNVNSNWLVYYYDSSKWYRSIYSNSTEGARNHGLLNIFPNDFFNTKIAVPSTLEQTKIGEFFNHLNKLIGLQSSKLEHLKSLKKGYLQNMFTSGDDVPRLRFKGFSDEWKINKLGNTITFISGNDGQYTNIPILTISAKNRWMKQSDRFSKVIAGKELKRYTLLKRGELSYNHGNSKASKYGAVFELKEYSKALVPKVYHSFKVHSFMNAAFIDYLFTSKIPDRELRKLVSSGARMDGLLNINKHDFASILIRFPEKNEQTKIGEFFNHFDKLIELQSSKLEHLKRDKKAYLQKMFM